MGNEQLIRFVTKHLDASVTKVEHAHRERLKSGRQLALAHQTHRAGIRFAGMHGSAIFEFFPPRLVLKALALLFLTVGIAYWHASDYIIGLEEVDSAILTDEMPMDVITDKGFDAWLKSSATH